MSEETLPKKLQLKRKVAVSDALSAAAVLISLFALLFTALQWRESHNQLLLSMKPSVDFDTETDTDEFPVGVSIGNAGPGPAIIKSITYYVDKKAIGDRDKLENFTDFPNMSSFDFDEGDTLAVGEHQWLLSCKNKPHGKKEEKELNDFADFVEHHLALEVKFCPALPGECSTKCSTKGWCK